MSVNYWDLCRVQFELTMVRMFAPQLDLDLKAIEAMDQDAIDAMHLAFERGGEHIDANSKYINPEIQRMWEFWQMAQPFWRKGNWEEWAQDENQLRKYHVEFDGPDKSLWIYDCPPVTKR